MKNAKKIQETRKTLAKVFLDVDDIFTRLYSLKEDLSNLRTEVRHLVHILIPEARNLPFKAQTDEILRKIAGRTKFPKDSDDIPGMKEELSHFIPGTPRPGDDIRKALDEVNRKTRKRPPKKGISRRKGP